MLPRLRFDQLMDLGWRKMMPLALCNIVFYAVLLWGIAMFRKVFEL
jgi:NADH-quinone oxidoreductase subunit H